MPYLLACSPLLCTAPTVAVGTGSSATTVATESAATAEVGAMAGHEKVPDAGAAPRSTMEPQAEEIPPSDAAAGGIEVLDLTGDASEEEDMTTLLEAADEEVEEETDPNRSEALPDEAVQETGAQYGPLEEAPSSAMVPAAPNATTGMGTPDASTQAAAVADMPPLSPSGAETWDETKAAAEVPGGMAVPAALPSEWSAAEDVEEEVAPRGEVLALATPGRAAALVASGAPALARSAVPVSEKGKESAPQETLSEASSG
jgi:hypothetical protein